MLDRPDKRCRDFNWTMRGDDGVTSFAGAQLAVLMDIRDELQELNRRLRCPEFTRMPQTLREIRRNTAKPKRKPKVA